MAQNFVPRALSAREHHALEAILHVIVYDWGFDVVKADLYPVGESLTERFLRGLLLPAIEPSFLHTPGDQFGASVFLITVLLLNADFMDGQTDFTTLASLLARLGGPEHEGIGFGDPNYLAAQEQLRAILQLGLPGPELPPPARRLSVAGNDCIICHRPLEADPDAEITNDAAPPLPAHGQVPIVFCYSCGKPLHKNCLQSWFGHLRAQGSRPMCPNCRAPWQDQAEA